METSEAKCIPAQRWAKDSQNGRMARPEEYIYFAREELEYWMIRDKRTLLYQDSFAALDFNRCVPSGNRQNFDEQVDSGEVSSIRWKGAVHRRSDCGIGCKWWQVKGYALPK